jgi:AraC-like DNA-binding protein
MARTLPRCAFVCVSNSEWQPIAVISLIQTTQYHPNRRSNARRFAHPADFGEAVRAAQVEVTIAGHGDYTARLTRIDLHRLWMQRLSDSLPHILHAAHEPKRAIVTFVAQPGQSLVTNGVMMPPGAIMRHSEAHDYHQRSSGAMTLAAMSLPIEDMASIGTAVAGCDLGPPHDALIVKPSPSAMAVLQRLHAAVGHLAETAPEIIAHPEAARGLEQALIEAMVGCLSSGDTIEDRSAQRRHKLIMQRFLEMIEEHRDQALYVPEICRTIGVTERTLRACCQEHLGMSPKHYLLRRRMHFARRDLRRAMLSTTTVTEVAAGFGFWHFGRFASAYRSLFGELPLATLGRAPE